MLDDFPLAPNEVSSSVLLASHASIQLGQSSSGGGNLSTNIEVEMGLLTLFYSDGTGIQVCDPNGRWYTAYNGCGVGDLLLITGKTLSYATASLRPAASYKATTDHLSGSDTRGRTSLAFSLMPKNNAILDCSPIEAAGHVIPQSYVPVSVSQFMDDLLAEKDTLVNPPVKSNVCKEPSLRSVLSHPIYGASLEDAMVVSCGHSFGGLMLQRVLDMSRCPLCNAEIDTASAIKQQDDQRLFYNEAIRRWRKKEKSDQMDVEDGDPATDDGMDRVVQYPFAVNEKVLIKGNRRTPEKFVGKEAIVTSQCRDGWYRLEIVDSGENVWLQYGSLEKMMNVDRGEGSATSGEQ